MDERIRVRTSDRRAARSADPPRSYPRDERRVLSPEALQGPTTAPARSRAGRRRRPQYRRNPRPLIITEPPACCSRPLFWLSQQVRELVSIPCLVLPQKPPIS